LLGDLERTLSADLPDAQERVRLVRPEAEQVPSLFAPSSFDAVLCHGVLMYFADPDPLLDALPAVVAPGASSLCSFAMEMR
jgi:hypothetical protein